MRAIIPVAGPGTKLRPHTYSQPKALIPLAGKTVLGIIVDQLYNAGVSEFVFVVGYLGDKIEDYISEQYPFIKAIFVYQNLREGTAHAVKITKDFVENDEVFIVLGDTICEYDVKAIIDLPYSALGIKRVDDPTKFGVVELDENDNETIVKLIEKPTIPTSNNALVGLYKIKETEKLFNCLEMLTEQGAGLNGNFTITEALQCMINQGTVLKTFKVDNWYDCGNKESLLASNAVLLKKMEPSLNMQYDFENTILISPVTIGENCIIKNAIIGPNVAIGSNVNIDRSIINNTIIGGYTRLYNVVMENSLIGNDVFVNGLKRNLNIGDNTELNFG
jgi:glucose-1-phosphate thymidylyltransferase